MIQHKDTKDTKDTKKSGCACGESFSSLCPSCLWGCQEITAPSRGGSLPGSSCQRKLASCFQRYGALIIKACSSCKLVPSFRWDDGRGVVVRFASSHLFAYKPSVTSNSFWTMSVALSARNAATLAPRSRQHQNAAMRKPNHATKRRFVLPRQAGHGGEADFVRSRSA